MSNQNRRNRRDNKNKKPPINISTEKPSDAKEANVKCHIANSDHSQDAHMPRHRAWPDYLNLFFTGSVAVATIFYVCISSYQLNALKGQLDVMKSQLGQMELANRPSIGIDEEIGLHARPITIDSNGTARMICNITVKNFGSRPAHTVLGYAELMLSNDLNPVYAREKSLFDNAGNMPKHGSTIFPSGHQSFQWPSEVTKSQIIGNRTSATQPEVLAWVVGVIGYHDDFGNLHRTAFCYRLQQPEGAFGVAFGPTTNTTINGDWVAHDTISD